jgi:hypothetical protein
MSCFSLDVPPAGEAWDVPDTAINVEPEKAVKLENLRGVVKNQRKTASLTKLTMKRQDYRKSGQRSKSGR